MDISIYCCSKCEQCKWCLAHHICFITEKEKVESKKATSRKPDDGVHQLVKHHKPSQRVIREAAASYSYRSTARFPSVRDVFRECRSIIRQNRRSED